MVSKLSLGRGAESFVTRDGFEITISLIPLGRGAESFVTRDGFEDCLLREGEGVDSCMSEFSKLGMMLSPFGESFDAGIRDFEDADSAV